MWNFKFSCTSSPGTSCFRQKQHKLCMCALILWLRLRSYDSLKDYTVKQLKAQISPSPISILHKSTAGRYRPIRVTDVPITARCRFINLLAGSGYITFICNIASTSTQRTSWRCIDVDATLVKRCMPTGIILILLNFRKGCNVKLSV